MNSADWPVWVLAAGFVFRAGFFLDAIRQLRKARHRRALGAWPAYHTPNFVVLAVLAAGFVVQVMGGGRDRLLPTPRAAAG